MLRAAVAYFGLVFGAGFAFGTVRVLWVVPRLGVRSAELIESPVMLLATILAAGWVNAHVLSGASRLRRLQVGSIALVFLLAAEVALGTALRCASPLEILFDKDPVSGTVYYALIALYALMPWMLTWRNQA